MTTGTGAEDRDPHHGCNCPLGHSTNFFMAESVQGQARRLHALPRHATPLREDHTEERWSD